MEIQQCATLSDLMAKLKTSMNVSAWIGYLEIKEELERKRMESLLGEGQ